MKSRPVPLVLASLAAVTGVVRGAGEWTEAGDPLAAPGPRRLSGDGRRVALQTPDNAAARVENVQVLGRADGGNGGFAVPVGAAVPGDEQIRYDVNGAGDRVVIGVRRSSRYVHVRVHGYDEGTGTWPQMGGDILRQNATRYEQMQVAMDASGDRICVSLNQFSWDATPGRELFAGKRQDAIIAP
jgi:hypothetical protein